jgi:hypothetical protein
VTQHTHAHWRRRAPQGGGIIMFYSQIKNTSEQYYDELKVRLRAHPHFVHICVHMRTNAESSCTGTCRARCAAQDKPHDREVEELLEIFEQTEAPLLRAVEARVKWTSDELPHSVRALLILGAVTMGLACTGVRYYGAKCFTVRASLARASMWHCESRGCAMRPC